MVGTVADRRTQRGIDLSLTLSDRCTVGRYRLLTWSAMGELIVDAPRRTAKQWGLPLRPPAKRKQSGELVIEDAKPADPPRDRVTRAEAVRVVMPALTQPVEPLPFDPDAIAGELDDVETTLEPRRTWWIVVVVAAVVVATTWALLAL